MPNYRFGGVLNAARWPFIAALQGRTVIEPIYDAAAKEHRGYAGTEESEGNILPQLMYCENVMPDANGLGSVGYQELIPASAHTEFDQCFVLRGPDEAPYVYSPAGGKNYFLNLTTLAWGAVNSIAPTPGTQVSRAQVSGRMFICYAGVNVYEYLPGPNTLLPVALTLPAGVAVTDIRGIGSSSNYLIIFTYTGVYWSSLIDPTDFAASVSTGAGGAIPQDIRGQLVVCQPTSGGFILFTTKNAVAAVFTNNTRAPFIFKEIAGAGGIYRTEQVTADNISGAQYAWTTNGLQRITLQQAEFLSAEVNDYIGGRSTMFWNAATKTLDVTAASTTEYVVKLTLISNRFLCLSYTDDQNLVPVFNYSLVYDLALKRWGQLNQPHVDIFPFQVPTSGTGLTFNDLAAQTFNDLGGKTFNQLVGATAASGNPSSKRMLALLTGTGRILLALMDYSKDFTHAGVAIFGRHQMVRAKLMEHQTTIFEGTFGSEVSGSETFSAHVINSIDGYELPAALPLTKIYGKGKQQQYGGRKSGINQCTVALGTFMLTSYIMEAGLAGDD
jgi:hypothetical protein